MSNTFVETITLEKITAGCCGGTFALSAKFIETKKREGGGFHCPYCGQERGWWKSETDKLKEQLEQKNRELTSAKTETLRANHLLIEEREAKVAAEKKLKRVGKGVCPCCNRTFQNLGRHMATKHPLP